MRALVTGATGFLGGYLVRALVRRGDRVRVLTRHPSGAAALQAEGAEIRQGDFADPRSIEGIATDTDVVFHLVRSPTAASSARFDLIDVKGCGLMLAEARRAGAARLVYVSTLAGYAPGEPGRERVVDERSALDHSGMLGNYVKAKAAAEQLVRAANLRNGALETVIVRLGLVCGTGTSVLPAHVCQPLGRGWAAVFGDGSVPLPLVYVDNAVDALILAGVSPGAAGEVFNIVEDEVLTQRDYLELLHRSTGGRPRVLRLPVASYYLLGWLSEILAALKGKEPATNRYRIKSRLAHLRFDCSKARDRLQWRPRVSLRAGLRATFENYAGARSAGGC